MSNAWPIKRIGDVCDVFTGGTPSKSKPEYFESGDIPWLVSGDIHKKEITECEGRITELGLRNSNAKYLPADSVLIALNGQGKTRATVAVLRMRATCNQSLVCMSPKDRSLLLPEYLFANLHGRYEELRKLTGDSGNDRRGLNMAMIKALKIPVAPLPEQERIVAILDEAFAGIAEAVANTEKNVANGRELFKSYLNAVFSQRGEGWEIRKLGEMTTVQSGGTPLRSRPDYWGGEIPWYSSGELNDLSTARPARYITDVGLKNSNAKMFCAGSLLIGMYDTAALKMAILDRKAAFNQAIAGATPAENLDLRFVFFAINAFKSSLLLQRRGVRQKNLSLSKIKDIELPVPPLAIQRDVADRLHSLKQDTDRLQDIGRQKLIALAELKQSILLKAFSGELTSTPQKEIETALA